MSPYSSKPFKQGLSEIWEDLGMNQRIVMLPKALLLSALAFPLTLLAKRGLLVSLHDAVCKEIGAMKWRADQMNAAFELRKSQR